MSEITGTLENWKLDPHYRIVWGNLYDDVHKRWEDGQWIHTSSCVTPLGAVKEGDIIETLNSTYLLGKPFRAEYLEDTNQ